MERHNIILYLLILLYVMHRHPLCCWVSVAYSLLAFPILVLVSTSTALPTTDHLGVLVRHKPNFNTLVHVHAIWRHGDRTASTVLSSDTANDATSWNDGLGELTKEGIAQQYRLGKWLRQRYDAFLGERYSPAEVYVRSSDFNRTLMSAQANLAALFPPPKEQRWNDDLRWQPIPVHTVAKENDPELCESIRCPEAESEVKRTFSENEEALEVEAENAAMLAYIGSNAGWSRERFRLADMWFVFDPLNAVLHHNETHKLPSWVNASVWDAIVRLYDISCQFYFVSDKVKRLRGGMLLKEIVDRLRRKAENITISREKFFAYSAHDMTIGSILSVLGLRPAVFPLYSTLLLLELHKEGERFIVKLFYKNITDSPLLYEFPIEGCTKPCSMESFIARSLKYIPADWNDECGISLCCTAVPHVYIGVIVSLSIFSVLLSIFVMVDFLKKCMERHQRYEGRVRLPTSEQSSENFA